MQAATQVNAEQASHDDGLVKRSYHGDIETSPVASVSKVQARLRDVARFRARSTSHAVAAHKQLHQEPAFGGQSSGRREPFSKAAFQAMACYGSSTWIRQESVLGDDGITLVYSLGFHRNAFNNDTAGHVFPERNQ